MLTRKVLAVPQRNKPTIGRFSNLNRGVIIPLFPSERDEVIDPPLIVIAGGKAESSPHLVIVIRAA